jgi:glycosyltransferase involved in cell wall biosynthesis
MRKFMLISYVFPPAGGAGVQRALKLVKYIVRHGWRPVVVTPRSASAPVQDDSYSRDLPLGTIVERLPTLEPSPRTAGEKDGDAERPSALAGLGRFGMELLFPDRHVIWLASALPGALAAARRHHVEAVVVTGPPFSSFMLGRAVAASTGLPLVLDFRDDWSGFFSKGFRAHGGGPLWKRAVVSLERSLVRSSSRVVATTPALCHRLRRLHGGLEDKFVWIPNGYDPEDYGFIQRYPPPPGSPDGRLHLLYAGTVFQSHPLDDLWAGAALLAPAERRRISIEIMGRAVPGQVLDPGLEGLAVSTLPYMPHEQAVQRMALADALVMTLAAIPGLEHMVPAKLYEHLALRRPTLAISPPGAATAIIEACAAGQWLPPGDAQGVAKVLRNWLDAPPPPLGPPPRLFNRASLAGWWARLLDEAVQEER